MHVPGGYNGIPLWEPLCRCQICRVAILIPWASLARRSTIRRRVWSSLWQRYRDQPICLSALMSKRDTSKSAAWWILPEWARKHISNVLPWLFLGAESILLSVGCTATVVTTMAGSLPRAPMVRERCSRTRFRPRVREAYGLLRDQS